MLCSNSNIYELNASDVDYSKLFDTEPSFSLEKNQPESSKDSY